MSLVIALLALLLPAFVASTPFQHRGNDANASNWNLTSSAASIATFPTLVPSTSLVRPPYPILGTAAGNTTENGGRARPTGKGPSGNGTCGGCVVNVPNANVDWWYAATFKYPIASLVTYTAKTTNATAGPKLLSRVPVTEAFDTAETVQGYAYTETSTWDSVWNESVTYWDVYPVIPSATVTSVVYRTAALPLPSDGIIKSDDWLSYSIVPSAASIAVTGPSRTAFVATSTTPFAYFSVYEVEKQFPVTALDGRVACQTVTQTFNLSDPYAFVYESKGIENQTVASGDVPAAFLEQIPQTSCRAGSFEGVVTVVVVVDLIYELEDVNTPFIVHVESSVIGLEGVPTETPEPSSAQSTIDQFFEGSTVREESTADPFFEGSTVHEESTAAPLTGSPQQTSAPDVIAQAFSTGAASGLAIIFPAFKSFMTEFAHLEQTATLTDDNEAQQTAAPSETGVAAVKQAPATTEIIGTVGSQVVKVVPASAIIVGTQTLVPGGSAITIAGVPVSLAPSATAIVVNGQTLAASELNAASSQAQAPPVITVGSSVLTANAATQYYVAPGQILTAGGQVTVGGTVISLGPSASYLVVGGSTQVLSAAPRTAAGEAVLSVGNSAFTAVSGSTFVISGQTLTPGGTIVVGGTTLVLGQSASVAIVNGVTQTLSAAAAQITAPPLTIGNGVFSAQPGSGTTYYIGGSVLTPGGVITVAGSTISLAPGATALVVNGKTTNLLPSAAITNAPLLTIGSSTFTALPGTGTTFVIGGQTLTPGGVITVSGTTISLSPSATALVFGSGSSKSTETLFPATTTRNPSAVTTGSGALSAGATPTGAAKASSSHGAASISRDHGYHNVLCSLFTFLLGYLIAWI